MTEERFKQTSYKMSFEEYKKCDCTECNNTDCIHRNAYRRMPEIDGGLGLCPNLKGVRAWANYNIYSKSVRMSSAE